MRTYRRKRTPHLAAVLLVPLLFLLQACGASEERLWAGYRPPDAGSFRAGGDPGCPRVGVQNLSADQGEAIAEVVAQVCGILGSERFARELRARTDWLASCAAYGTRADAGPDVVAGEELLARLRQPMLDFSVVARRPALPGAIALAEPVHLRIAIRPLWFEHWRSGSVEQRALMVETVAHELSHLAWQRLGDNGQGSAACPRERLASYGVGAITARIWRERQEGLALAERPDISRAPARSAPHLRAAALASIGAR